MIDIHSHIVFDVDDGSESLEQSIKYLKEAKKIGVNKIIVTPHMYRGNKEKAIKIVHNFLELREIANKLGVELYIGNEVLYSHKVLELLKTNKVITLNRSKYLLIEFKRNEKRNFDDIINILNDIADSGYIPILAHPELYVNYRKIKNYQKLKDNGILLQIDSTSILNDRAPIKTYLFAKKLLKEKLVDFVASDTHCTKKRDYKSLRRAYKIIARKDKKYADIIFEKNALNILK